MYTLAISIVLQSHLNADDADMCMESLDGGYLSSVDGKTEVVVNCLVRFLFWHNIILIFCSNGDFIPSPKALQRFHCILQE